MRYVLRFLCCSVLALVFFSGCNGPASSNPGSPAFPSYLAGTWQAEDGVWKIVLEPNGTVGSVLVPMGEAEVRPNQTTEFEMKDGSISHITAGECIAEYNPSTRELFISVEQKEVYILIPDYIVTGNSIDIFRGPVSRDGKTWNAEWTNVFNFPLFPQDENEIIPQPLVFKKVVEKPKVADSNVVRQ
jgi:hypothetical protein